MKALAVVLVVAALAVPVARADGDPASDYLITQPAFLPFDAHVDKASANELAGLLAASKKAGFEIRVAVISSKIDLGAVPVLYRKPQIYAHFLGQELFYWYKHELLVVMPNGYGVYRHGLEPADQKAVDALPPPGSTSGTVLVNAANRAVKVLAKQNAVTLPSAVATGGGSSANSDRIVIAGVAAGAALLTAGFIYLRSRR